MISQDDVDELTTRAFAEMTAARGPEGPVADLLARHLSSGEVLEGADDAARLRGALEALADMGTVSAGDAPSRLEPVDPSAGRDLEVVDTFFSGRRPQRGRQGCGEARSCRAR